jgi:hypothetical protein
MFFRKSRILPAIESLNNVQKQKIKNAITRKEINNILFGEGQSTNNVNEYKKRIRNLGLNEQKNSIYRLVIDPLIANQSMTEIEGAPGVGRRIWTGTKSTLAGALSGLSGVYRKINIRTDPAAAQVARLNAEINSLKNKPNKSPNDEKNLQNKIARRASILATKNPEQRRNILAVSRGEPGEKTSKNEEYPIYNFSKNPLSEIARAKKNYMKRRDPEIIGQILQGMADIWTKRTSDTAARATLKRFVNLGPGHRNISKMYTDLTEVKRGNNVSLSKLLGSRYKFGNRKEDILKLIGSGMQAFGPKPYAPPPMYPSMPPPQPMYPSVPQMPPPMYPSVPQMPPRVEEVVTRVGGIERANNLVKNAGGPEIIKMASQALNTSRGNIQVAMKKTGLPATTFTNVKKLGGPQLATKVATTLVIPRVVVRRAPVKAVVRRRAPVKAVIRRRRTKAVTRKKQSSVKTRKILAYRELKKLIHKLPKKRLELQVAQCLRQ